MSAREQGRTTSELLFEGTLAPGEAIVRALLDGGVDTMIGIPGGNTHVVFDALHDVRDRIRTLLVREESLGSVMAEVYGKQTRRPAVLLAQGPWVVSNAAMGMLEALTAGTPMVVLTDLTDGGVLSHHAAYQSATGDWGGWDLTKSLAGITKQTIVARTPAQAVQAVQLALKHSTAGQPGPVAVVLASPALTGEVAADGLPRLYPSRHYLVCDRRPADAAAVDETARALVDAHRPVLICGGGVRSSGAARELLALAEALGAPVVATNGGKGAVPERHPLVLGLMGTFGLDEANEAVARADVVLAVGTKLGPVDTAGESRRLLDPDRQELFQVDIEPRNASWTFPTRALVGDAAATLERLTAAVAATGARANGADQRALIAWDEPGSFATDASTSDAVPLLPQRVIHELSRRLPASAVACCDAGENRLFMAMHHRTGDVNGFVQAAGIGGMGFAIPAALGAKLAEPERMAVAVCGDGGFAMAMNGLMTAVEERLPILVVVLNNRMLGWVKHDQSERVIASEFHDFDLARIARALGCAGHLVRTPDELVAALDACVARQDEPALIDVRISQDSSFLETLSSFASRDWKLLV